MLSYPESTKLIAQISVLVGKAPSVLRGAPHYLWAGTSIGDIFYVAPAATAYVIGRGAFHFDDLKSLLTETGQ